MRAWIPLVVLAACGRDDDGGTPRPAPLGPCDVPRATDLDPSPDVVEVAFSAAPGAWDPGTGTPVDGLVFGGSLPGPVIEVTVGQTLRVRFTNETDAPTTLHWHGLRVPEAMDGIAQMMDPVAPGDTFTYAFEVKDAGFYWYHPHMDTAGALEAGLYGAIVARAPGEVPASCDVPLVLDDVLLDRDTGQLEPPGSPMDQVMGRLGNHLLANGRQDRRYGIVAGDTAVLRLVNAANARHLDLGIDGVPLTVLATDGGWLAEPVVVDRLSLAPGERAIVSLDAPETVGDELVVTSRRVHLHEEGGDMMEYDPLGDDPVPFFSLVTVDGEPTGFAPPAFDPAPDVVADDPVHTWVLEEQMMQGTVTIDGARWPDVPMVEAPADTLSTFVIDNLSEMRHPFHVHGNRFVVVDVGGVAPAEHGWKDTFDVPPRTRATIVSPLDNPGEWMYHCHILEHADNGMAGLMTVGAAGR